MTYGELKARIILETNKDDLEDDRADALETAIKAAIRHYQSRRFWFNETVATVTTSSGVKTVTRPDVVTIDRVTVPALGSILRKVPLQVMKEQEDLSTTTGQPCDWTEYGDSLRIWPTPNATYTLSVLGLLKAAELSADEDESIWTDEGADLIVARAKVTLYRDVYTDPRLQNAMLAEQQVLNEMKAETARRLSTGLC